MEKYLRFPIVFPLCSLCASQTLKKQQHDLHFQFCFKYMPEKYFLIKAKAENESIETLKEIIFPVGNFANEVNSYEIWT